MKVPWLGDDKKSNDAFTKLTNIIQLAGLQIYAIIDEYDNFANTMLADSESNYMNLTHGEVKALLKQARVQLPNYINAKHLTTEAKDGNWTLHPIILVFKGWELAEYEVMG